jgi:hypothetical protein
VYGLTSDGLFIRVKSWEAVSPVISRPHDRFLILITIKVTPQYLRKNPTTLIAIE